MEGAVQQKSDKRRFWSLNGGKMALNGVKKPWQFLRNMRFHADSREKRFIKYGCENPHHSSMC